MRGGKVYAAIDLDGICHACYGKFCDKLPHNSVLKSQEINFSDRLALFPTTKIFLKGYSSGSYNL